MLQGAGQESAEVMLPEKFLKKWRAVAQGDQDVPGCSEQSRGQRRRWPDRACGAARTKAREEQRQRDKPLRQHGEPE